MNMARLRHTKMCPMNVKEQGNLALGFLVKLKKYGWGWFYIC